MNGLNAVRVQYRSMIGGVERLPSVASAPRHRRRSAGVVAILQSLLALITRSAGKLLNTAVGWATVMLFPRR